MEQRTGRENPFYMTMVMVMLDQVMAEDLGRTRLEVAIAEEIPFLVPVTGCLQVMEGGRLVEGAWAHLMDHLTRGCVRAFTRH